MPKDKNKIRKEQKTVNISIAPLNWVRLQKYILKHNEDPNRSSPKIKYTDVINQVIKEYFASPGHNIKS